jgi:hypothetical protein
VIDASRLSGLLHGGRVSQVTYHRIGCGCQQGSRTGP